MELIYHTEICKDILAQDFSQRALDTIIAANHRLDGIFTGLVGHPEYHFDDNKIAEGWAYVEDQHTVIAQAISKDDDIELAWKAFGRLLHVVQDFYSHSNYINLLLEKYSDDQLPAIKNINGMDETIYNSSRLHTAVVYYPLEALTYFPFMRPLLRPLLPADSHANMNLDSPEMGPLFYYSIEAAHQRSEFEYKKSIQNLNSAQIERFYDK